MYNLLLKAKKYNHSFTNFAYKSFSSTSNSTFLNTIKEEKSSISSTKPNIRPNGLNNWYLHGESNYKPISTFNLVTFNMLAPVYKRLRLVDFYNDKIFYNYYKKKFTNSDEEENNKNININQLNSEIKKKIRHDILNYIKLNSNIKELLHNENKNEETDTNEVLGLKNSSNIMHFDNLSKDFIKLTLNSYYFNHRREEEFHLLWKTRAYETLKFFRKYFFNKMDIIALQEFWLDSNNLSMFSNEFKRFNYEEIYYQRTGDRKDSLALLINKDKFTIKAIQKLQLCNARDRVALIVLLKDKLSNKEFVLVNTHLSFPHDDIESLSQLNQMNIITNTLKIFINNYYNKDNEKGNIDNSNEKSKTPTSHNDIPIILCGDFNVDIDSLLCNNLRKVGFFSVFDIQEPSKNTSYYSSHHNNGTNKLHSKTSSTQISPFNPIKKLNPKLRDSNFKYVSHINHMGEEVGVDHIFLHSNTEKVYSYGNYYYNFNNNELYKSVLNSDYFSTHTHVLQDDCSTSSSSNENNNINNNNLDSLPIEPFKKKKNYVEHHILDLPYENLFVGETNILPYHIPYNNWPSSFFISDHRPISCQFIIGRQI